MEQNLSLYRVFYTVANTGNISKAAEQLFISQPAISKSIRKLEQSLDVTLFSRNSRGVQLTEEGEILYTYVKKRFFRSRQENPVLKKSMNLALVIYILESVQLYVNLCFCLIFRNLLKRIHI